MQRVSGRTVFAALFLIPVTVLLISCEQAQLPRKKTPHPAQTRATSVGQRIIAIGDLHGDLHAARRALQLARVMNEERAWIGDSSRVVQLGDILDRGDHELEILELFDHLSREAEDQGGAVIQLNGNHEIMNVQLDFRYVTDAGFTTFQGFEATHPLPDVLQTLPEYHRGRAAAFRPGGPWAKRLARNPVIVLIDSTVFVHGGLLPEHVRHGIDTINGQIRKWMLGHVDEVSDFASGSRSPIWVRDLSANTSEEDCKRLKETLRLVGAKRLVVGHTVQEHINCACDSLVWRVDTGMASAYGGPVEVLELRGHGVRILR
jgi:hypothetical protein